MSLKSDYHETMTAELWETMIKLYQYQEKYHKREENEEDWFCVCYGKNYNDDVEKK